MSRYEIERDIDGFIERWLERTADFDDFVPANIIWEAMLHSAGLQANRKRVWNMSRISALEYMRRDLDLTRQQARYYHLPKRVAGMPPGVVLGCYERLKLTEYAVKALDAPMQVRPRVPRRALARV